MLMRTILLNKEQRDKLQEVFGCSRSSISLATQFKNESIRARRIREYAINTLKCHYFSY